MQNFRRLSVVQILVALNFKKVLKIMFVHGAHCPVRSLFMWQREGQLRHVAGQMAPVYSCVRV